MAVAVGPGCTKKSAGQTPSAAGNAPPPTTPESAGREPVTPPPSADPVTFDGATINGLRIQELSGAKRSLTVNSVSTLQLLLGQLVDSQQETSRAEPGWLLDLMSNGSSVARIWIQKGGLWGSGGEVRGHAPDLVADLKRVLTQAPGNRAAAQGKVTGSRGNRAVAQGKVTGSRGTGAGETRHRRSREKRHK